MFSFKNEIEKYPVLPELEGVDDPSNDNNIEDIMDVLKSFEKTLGADKDDLR